MDRWKFILEFYKNKFNYPYYITDLLSVFYILKDCCCGMSNRLISAKYDIDLERVRMINLTYLGFIGWQENLEVSPLAIYNYGNGFQYFTANFPYSLGIRNENDLKVIYNGCEKFNKIKEILQEYDN